jgi:hypothetical protein
MCCASNCLGEPTSDDCVASVQEAVEIFRVLNHIKLGYALNRQGLISRGRVADGKASISEAITCFKEAVLFF